MTTPGATVVRVGCAFRLDLPAPVSAVSSRGAAIGRFTTVRLLRSERPSAPR